MSIQGFPQTDTSGCCQAPAPVAPKEIKNRPGLPTIAYRVATYAGFRQAMIAAIAEKTELRRWTARTSDDYGIALLEMWAYLADILTFYQERIANEAFLRTAGLRESVLRLAALLDYKPAPGVAATADLAFTVEAGKQVEIPEGLRAQSVPGQDEKPQKFETVESLTVSASLNEIRLRTTRPYTLGMGNTQAIVKGTNHDLKVNDYILVVGEEREQDPGSERWEVRRLTDVQVDSDRGITTITWREGLGTYWPRLVQPPEHPKLFVFRLQAWPFGYNAPNFALLSDNIRAKIRDWTGKSIRDPDHPDHIFLDNVYDTIHRNSWIALVTAETPIGLAAYPGYREAYRVEEVAETVKLGYTLTSNVTRLTVDGIEQLVHGEKVIVPEHIDYFPMQGTSVLAQSEELELTDAPKETPAAGKDLDLDGRYPDLQRGRRLILTGELADESAGQGTEVIEVESVCHNEDQTHTSLTLKDALQGSYKAETVRLFGNVVRATHGETVADEVLGSGDASASFQSFALRKSPVTFVPQPDAPHGAANTLEVRVDGVLWHETPTLYRRERHERVYATTVDNEGVMTVQCGDGVTGARLPSGRNNVAATYRQGLGREGNVKADSLATLLDRPLGLKSVTNPSAAQGGADPETRDTARTNAPNTVRTFGRIVSLRDFEDAAREFSGVAKARATCRWQREEQIVHLTVAGDEGDPISGEPYKNLVHYLDSRRDPNRKLVVENYQDVLIEVTARIQVHPDYLDERVQADAVKALEDYFDFDNLDLGQSIHLSDIYRVLQDVEGVVAVVIDRFGFKQPANVSARAFLAHLRTRGASFLRRALPDPVQPHLRIEPTELARIEDHTTDLIVNVGIRRP